MGFSYPHDDAESRARVLAYQLVVVHAQDGDVLLDDTAVIIDLELPGKTAKDVDL